MNTLKMSAIISDKIYIGSAEDAFSKEFMTKVPTAVLNCAAEVGRSPYAVSYMHVPLHDHNQQEIVSYIDSTNNFITSQLENGNRVLVHCYAGVSRAPSIVIAYLKSLGLSFHEAFDLVKRKRQVINPNIGFIYQLV